jgi:hypothetical protein
MREKRKMQISIFNVRHVKIMSLMEMNALAFDGRKGSQKEQMMVKHVVNLKAIRVLARNVR